MVSLDQWRAVIGTLWKFIHHKHSKYQLDRNIYILFTYPYFTKIPLYFSINSSVNLASFIM